MNTDLAKNYDPATVEADAYSVWINERLFAADPNAPGAPYSIVIPPPNVTGALHLGHAINNTLQDILTRLHRMMGDNTLWIPGIDHAGIATQAVVEKQLKEQEGLDRHQVGREKLVERIWKWKEQFGDRIISQLKRLGCSCDWERTRFTLDEMCARAVRETFFKLFRDGLIYRGKRLVNWDTHLLTSISDDELYTEAVKTSLWSIKYPIDGTDDFVVVATTRPETMLADTAVAYHSSNAKAGFFKGKQVRLPLTNRLVPLIQDDILVDPEFGTGYVKVTPAHDPNDYAVYSRHKGTPSEIGILNMMTPDGKVNDADPSWKQYAGLAFGVARKKIVEDLIAAGLLEESEIKPHEANVSFSDRSKTAIQPYLSDQWFVKMAPLAEPALQVVRDGTIKFFPERHAQQYLSWLGEKRDWPISRQLWWGHRIPVWTRPKWDGEDYSEASVRAYLQKYVVLPGFQNDEKRAAAAMDSISISYSETHLHLCLRNAEIEQAIGPMLLQMGYVQDADVLDTWFSSALWPHSTLGWPEQTDALKKWYPTAVLLTGRDIITLWVARMVMTGMYNMGDHSSSPQPSPANTREQEKALGIPFAHVAINPTILDGKGERMSKSKGNGVDPVEIIETHGADALRFTLTHMATETQDVRMPVKKLPNGKNTSEKFDLGRNFCNKLWNAAKLVLSNLEATPAATSTPAVQPLAERWIISRFHATVKEANESLAAYRFDQYARTCYDFFWRDLCDWYLEAVKPALRDPTRAPAACQTLAALLDGTLRLMHPMVPFITETIWWRLNEVRPQRGVPGLLDCPASARLIKAAWPKVGMIDDDALHVFPRIQEIVSAIRNLRNEHRVDKKTVIAVHISPPGDQAVRATRDNKELIELLGTCEVKTVQAHLAPPAKSIRATVNGDCEIYLEGLVNEDAEKQRLIKRREELNRELGTLKGRLANPAYTSKAPPQLVKQTQDRMAEIEAELTKLG